MACCSNIYFISSFKVKSEGFIIVYCGGERPATFTYWCYESTVNYKCSSPGLGSRTGFSAGWCDNSAPQLFAWDDPQAAELQKKAEAGFKSAFGQGTTGAVK